MNVGRESTPVFLVNAMFLKIFFHNPHIETPVSHLPLWQLKYASIDLNKFEFIDLMIFILFGSKPR